MDAGQNSSGLEQAVLAAERKVYVRSPWYNHRVAWGVIGLLVGLAAGPLYQGVLAPEKVSAREPQSQIEPAAHFAAQRLISDLQPKSVPQDKETEKVEAKHDRLAQAVKEFRGDVPFVSRDLEALPAVMPSPSLRGPISVAPYQPDINVEELKRTPPASQPKPTISDIERSRKVDGIKAQIASLKAQRDELLKSFYEDAIPVKHVDEDIAKAELELKAIEKT
jgi:hypothetical protein